MGESRKGRRKPGRGVTVRTYPNGTKAIVVQFHFRGVQCRETLRGLSETAANIRYAENPKAEIERKIRDGQFCYGEYFPRSRRAALFGGAGRRMTLGAALDEYLSDVKRSRPHSTYLAYKKSCDAHWYKWRDWMVADMVPADLREWARQQTSLIKTVRNHLIPLRAALDRCVNDGLIDRNPVDSIKLRELLSPEQKRSGYKVDPFNADERKAVLKAANEHSPRFEILIRFAFETGLRPSELMALRWSDLDGNQVVVSRAYVMGQIKGPKTAASNRRVDLNDDALRALRAQGKFTRFLKAEIFCRPKSNKPITRYEQIQGPWGTILTHSGVRHRRFNQTRHTFASTALSEGKPLLWVAGQLGHVDASLTLRAYSRWVENSETQEGRIGELGD